MERLTQLIVRHYPSMAALAPLITLVTAIGLVVYILVLITKRLAHTTRQVMLRTTPPGSAPVIPQGKSAGIMRCGHDTTLARPCIALRIPVCRT
jgi:hypothetical protein